MAVVMEEGVRMREGGRGNSSYASFRSALRNTTAGSLMDCRLWVALPSTLRNCPGMGGRILDTALPCIGPDSNIPSS